MKQYSFLFEWRNVATKAFGRRAAKAIRKANQEFDKCDKHPIKSLFKGNYGKGKDHSMEAIRHIYKGKKEAYLTKKLDKPVRKGEVLDDVRGIVNKATGVKHDKYDVLDMAKQSGIMSN